MKKNKHNFDLDNLVATFGFGFSGSSLLNDIFISSGYIAPKNIRADELFYNDKNFSWPRAINNEYSFIKRFNLALRLIKTMIIRIPLNVIQKTFIYDKYLILKGRDNVLHHSTSVNRSLWSYLVSFYMITFKKNYNRDLFVNWLSLKYKWQVKYEKNLLIDKGIPSDKIIADWFFGINRSIGIFVYRDPKMQYRQIAEFYKSLGIAFPSYSSFLNRLMSDYQSISWILDSDYKFFPVSFDKILYDATYRERLEKQFRQMNILKEIHYDFSNSIINNESLLLSYEEATPTKESIRLESVIEEYHKIFERKLDNCISVN